jgi:hypothetical protein
MGAGDCGGVREHGMLGHGSVEEPERSVVVLVWRVKPIEYADRMDHS